MIFETLEDMLIAAAESVRPPERLTVSEAAEKYRIINNPGSYVGPLKNDLTPYMVEPMDTLASADFTGLVFVGPAQSGKTDSLLLNWLTHTVVCDPADMTQVHPSQATARDFAKRRIERLYRHSPAVGDRRLPGRNNQNTFDTKFQSGMLLTLSWPTVKELSGKPIPRLALTDYDRMPQDLDGEGSPFDLARKRTTTFRRYGMTLAESSPGFEIESPKWVASTLHEAPPTPGILSLYNRGDRRRYYWRCPHCNEAFEPDFKLLHYPSSADMMESAEQAVMVCPSCGCSITHDPDSRTGNPGKHELNLGGRWVKDGLVWMPDGSMQGTPIRSDIASFWLKGVCAAFTDWKTLVFNYLKAYEEFEKTGQQEALKVTVNVDQGLPYMPQGVAGERLAEDMKSRAKELGDRVVPSDVRFLVASVDVQKSKFVVQVHGIRPGGDIVVIDRFDIRKSERTDEDGERYWVKPGQEPKDWLLLIPQVIEATYPLGDDSGREMAIKVVACDSAGLEGVTVNAYNFWRYLRDEHPADYHLRFQLVKGGTVKTAPRAKVEFPDSQRKDRKAAARGEVPVVLINTNAVKDQISGMLEREETGTGRIDWPKWLPDRWYSELVAETRTAKGWENLFNKRNEAFDLLVYAQAICLVRPVNVERIDWDDPPGWAAPWDANDLVFSPNEQARPFQAEESDELIPLEELGRLMS